jgi:hypothetical protein
MIALNPIQKLYKLNDVTFTPKKGNGMAYHHYQIKNIETGETLQEIHFQEGSRFEEDSTHGVIDSDLLEIVRHRLQCFQAGGLQCKENEKAICHIEEALLWMNQRIMERKERDVLGTSKK